MSDVPPQPLSYAAPPIAAVVPVPPSPAAVSVEELPRLLADARAAWRPVRRAVRYATFDAWTLAICAVLSVPCLAGGASGIVLAVALGVIAAVEFVGVRRLKRLDGAALRMLAVNQLVLAAAVAAYAGWNLYLVSHDQGIMALVTQQVGRGDPEVLSSARQVLSVLYGAMLVLGPAFPAGAALLYLTCRAKLARYVATTPAWVVKMQQERGTV